MEDLLQYFDFSEVDSVTAKLAGTDTVSFSDLFGLFIKGDFTGGLILILTWLVPYISALFDTVEALFQL